MPFKLIWSPSARLDIKDIAILIVDHSRSACDRGIETMKDTRYVKIVEWSEEDKCYVGSSPGLLYGGCHGDNEMEVLEELCRIVEEAIALYKKGAETLPPPTSGRDFANKMQDVT